MNRAGGYISLHRQMVGWEWYKDINTKVLFIHLLLTANFVDTKYQGKTISRGQVMTSLHSLSEETGLTIRQTRTSLSHLISTGEVTSKSYTKYRVISIVNYDKYQTERQTKRQANDKQPTNKTAGDRQHHNNVNKSNNANKGISSSFTPPTIEEVVAYIKEIGSSIDPGRFIDYYEVRDWVLNNGQKMKNWKAEVRIWQRREDDGRNGHNEPDRAPEQGKTNSKYEFLRKNIITV